MEKKISIPSLGSESGSLYLEDPLESKTEKKEPLYSSFQQWSSRAKCFQAYICATMTFSNIIQFFRAVDKFGIAILVPYIFFRLFIGVPAVLIEIMLGRYIMGFVTRVIRSCAFAKGIFGCSLIATFLTIIYKNLSFTYILKYLLKSFRGFIPWEDCQQPWAQSNCYAEATSQMAYFECLREYPKNVCFSLNWESAGTQYWKHVTNIADIGEALFSSFCLFVSIILILIVCYKRVQSVEKILALLAIIPIILSSCLAFGTFLIPGAAMSFKKVWFLDLSLLTTYELWLTGFEDTIVFLGLGMLALCCVSTHGRFSDDIILEVLLVNTTNILTCMLATSPLLCVIVTLYGANKEPDHRSPIFKNNLDVFIKISEVLPKYPYPKMLWVLMFYVEALLTSFGSQMIFVMAIWEVILGTGSEKVKYFYIYCTLGVSFYFISLALLFIPFSFEYPLGTCIATITLLSLLNLEIFYGIRRLIDDFHFMMGYAPPRFIKITLITSILLCTVFIVLNIYYNTPPYAYIYVVVPTLIYFLVACIEMCMAAGRNTIKRVFVSNPDWGPDNPLLKKSRIIFCSEAVTEEFMYRQELYKKSFMTPTNFSEQNVVQLV